MPAVCAIARYPREEFLLRCTTRRWRRSGTVFRGTEKVWRKQEDNEVTPVYEGVSLNIPIRVAFQFRNNGTEPLCFLITTMPPWPGEEAGKNEAVPTDGKWEVARG
jgi:hypothetical protein